MGDGRRDSGIQIRAITNGELGDWLRALDASFLMSTPDGAVAFFRELASPGRSLGAFSAQRCVGTLRSLDLEITVPGGAVVQACGITNVGVVPDHRRRGLLSRMMRLSLDDAMARGRGLAALIASEYRIYGRYASGRFALTTEDDGSGSVAVTGELADLAMDVSALGTLYLGDQTVHRLAAAGLVAEQRPGAISRADHMLRTPSRPWCPDGF